MKLKRPTISGNSIRKQVIRLSERDRVLILAGLNWIVANYRFQSKDVWLPLTWSGFWQVGSTPASFTKS